MQDRYAGDVGDFSKFALLRVLMREFQGNVGVVWYRFPDEVHNNDGRHINYLDNANWQICDNDLITKLLAVVESGSRSVKALEASGILPNDTRYFGDEVFPGAQHGWSRMEWFERAKTAMVDCEIVFVDPDNGIAGPNYRPNSLKAGKHITLDEIASLSRNHSCLVIYHHFDRSASHPDQIKNQMERIRSSLQSGIVIGLRYKRISPRAYFFVVQQSAVPAIERAISDFQGSDWLHHFEVFR